VPIRLCVRYTNQTFAYSFLHLWCPHPHPHLYPHPHPNPNLHLHLHPPTRIRICIRICTDTHTSPRWKLVCAKPRMQRAEQKLHCTAQTPVAQNAPVNPNQDWHRTRVPRLRLDHSRFFSQAVRREVQPRTAGTAASASKKPRGTWPSLPARSQLSTTAMPHLRPKSPKAQTTNCALSEQMTTSNRSASISIAGGAATPAQPTPGSAHTCAQDAEARITQLRNVQNERAREARTPLHAGAWWRHIAELDLSATIGHIPPLIKHGFRLGTTPITTHHHPPNRSSANKHVEVLAAQIKHELDSKQYIGYFTAAKLDAVLGPFQSSPQSCRPKPDKPGKFWLI
jgi:hypothetical protein